MSEVLSEHSSKVVSNGNEMNETQQTTVEQLEAKAKNMEPDDIGQGKDQSGCGGTGRTKWGNEPTQSLKRWKLSISLMSVGRAFQAIAPTEFKGPSRHG